MGARAFDGGTKRVQCPVNSPARHQHSRAYSHTHQYLRGNVMGQPADNRLPGACHDTPTMLATPLGSSSAAICAQITASPTTLLQLAYPLRVATPKLEADLLANGRPRDRARGRSGCYVASSCRCRCPASVRAACSSLFCPSVSMRHQLCSEARGILWSRCHLGHFSRIRSKGLSGG